LTRRRFAKRHGIGPSALRARETVGRRDGDAAKNERRWREISLASAIVPTGQNARRIG
jgi:hypothetical protein